MVTGETGLDARERFVEKKAAFRLAISASSEPSMKLFDSTIVHADLTIVHGNNLKPQDKGDRLKKIYLDQRAPGPIFMNEDDNGRETSKENLVKELASCDAVWAAGGVGGTCRGARLRCIRSGIMTRRGYAGRSVFPGGAGAHEEESDAVRGASGRSSVP